MRKTRLALDTLRVESFATGREPVRLGTVLAHAQTQWATCIGYGVTCFIGDTCYDGCVSRFCETPVCPRDTEVYSCLC